MPTDLGQAYPPTFTGYPPHMSAEDYQIWRRWFPLWKPVTTTLYFDVGLGEGRPTPPELSADFAPMWTRLNQKRADVVLVTKDAALLVELRAHAQLNAIGRLLGYMMLWAADNPLQLPTQPVLVTDVPDTDVATLARAHGITYITV